MIADRDVYWFARVLIDRYGEDAPGESLRRIAAYEEVGRAEERAHWQLVHEATKLLLRDRPVEGDGHH